MAKKAAIFNLIKSTFFKVHPHLKSHISFYSNGVAILSGFHDIRNMRPVEVNNGQYAAILNFIDMKFLQMHPLLRAYNLFHSDGVAILSGFHDIPQYGLTTPNASPIEIHV